MLEDDPLFPWVKEKEQSSKGDTASDKILKFSDAQKGGKSP